MSSFIDFFGTTVGVITNEKQGLVDVGTTETVSEVLLKLRENKINSVPVFKPRDSSSNESYCRRGKEYIGMVSAADIVSFILHNARLSSTPEVNADMISAYLTQPIQEAIGATFESSLNLAFTVVSPNTPLSQVVDEMFQGVHRCLVIDEDDHNIEAKVLTQTDVVSYFMKNAVAIPEIETALDRSVASVFQGEGLTSVTEDCLVVDALLKLKEHPAVAVVNQWGQIVANLSGSDVRDVVSTDTDFVSFLSMTVKEFLSTDAFTSNEESTPSEATDLGMNGTYRTVGVCTTVEGNLLANARYMLDNHIHRIWIVAPQEASGVDRFGIACLSLSDIIKVVRTHSTVHIDPLMAIS